MNCLEFEQKLLVNPSQLDEAAQQHLKGCKSCQNSQRESSLFEGRLKLAFEPKHLSVPSSAHKRTITRRHFIGGAIAASLAAVTVRHLSETDLSTEILSHITTPTLSSSKVVSAPLLQSVLESAGIKLLNNDISATYAKNCVIQSTIAAHLVLRGAEGPVSAFLMPVVPQEAVALHEHAPWVVRLAPFGKGSIAVVGLNQSACNKTEATLRNSLAFA